MKNVQIPFNANFDRKTSPAPAQQRRYSRRAPGRAPPPHRLSSVSSGPGALTGTRPVAPRHRPPLGPARGLTLRSRDRAPAGPPLLPPQGRGREWTRPGPSHTKWRRRRHRSRSARSAAIVAVPAPSPSSQSEPAVPLRDGPVEPMETRIAEEEAMPVSAAMHCGGCSPSARRGSGTGAVADSLPQDAPRPHVAGAVSRREAEGPARFRRGGGAANTEHRGLRRPRCGQGGLAGPVGLREEDFVRDGDTESPEGCSAGAAQEPRPYSGGGGEDPGTGLDRGGDRSASGGCSAPNEGAFLFSRLNVTPQCSVLPQDRSSSSSSHRSGSKLAHRDRN